MKLRAALPPLAACLTLSACTRLSGARAEPAVLNDPSPLARAELSRLVGQALNRPPVLLADDALMHEDVLIVQRRPHRDASGLLLNGRELNAPERFHVVKLGADCILIHEGSERRWKLRSARCMASGYPN